MSPGKGDRLKNFAKRIFHPVSLSCDIGCSSKVGAIELVKLQFPESFLSSIHCYQVQGKASNGQMAYGLGSDLDENLAVTKAYVEFLERAAYHTMKEEYGFDSTNGIAGHRFGPLAIRSALSEIHERDSFLLHWYLGVAMKHVKPPESVHSVIRDMKDNGYKTLFFKTYLGELPTYSCFLVDENTGGFVVGLSAGKTEKNDCEKAMTEALVNLYFGDYGYGDICLEELKTAGFSKLEHHRAYWLHVDQFPSWMIDPSKTNGAVVQKMTSPEEKFRIKYRCTTVVGYKSVDNLDISLGLPGEQEATILKKRMRCEFGGEMKFTSMRPHPIP